MRDVLEKLISLLEHKTEVLNELIERQEGLKRFLIKPDWSKYMDMTRPQEELLNRLRQIQSAQDYLMGDLAKRLRLTGKITLKGLVPCLEPAWQKALNSSLDKIKSALGKLRELTRLSQVLQQAQWRYLRLSEQLAGGGTPSSAVYNSGGYTQSAYRENIFVREV